MRNRNKHKRGHIQVFITENIISDEQNHIIFSLPDKILHFFSLLCGAVCAQLQHACKGQRAAVKNEFSPFTMWVLGTELRLSDLVARVFIH